MDFPRARLDRPRPLWERLGTGANGNRPARQQPLLKQLGTARGSWIAGLLSAYQDDDAVVD
eukprot:4914588-Pyramimonas_sp.AAC.1